MVLHRFHSVAAGMFPKGEADLVHHLMAQALKEVCTTIEWEGFKLLLGFARRCCTRDYFCYVKLAIVRRYFSQRWKASTVDVCYGSLKCNGRHVRLWPCDKPGRHHRAYSDLATPVHLPCRKSHLLRLPPAQEGKSRGRAGLAWSDHFMMQNSIYTKGVGSLLLCAALLCTYGSGDKTCFLSPYMYTAVLGAHRHFFTAESSHPPPPTHTPRYSHCETPFGDKTNGIFRFPFSRLTLMTLARRFT